MNIEISKIVRRSILESKPFAHVRDEPANNASVYLDANENPFGSPLAKKYNRYPDPLQRELKATLAKIKNVKTNNIFTGNGSDEIIDLAIRIFCRPDQDNVIICPPTFGMYRFSAQIQEVKVKEVQLLENFQLDLPGIQKAIDKRTKIIFICSPNNPTGNNMNREDMLGLIRDFNGIIFIDEAYINFSNQKSLITEIGQHNNVIISQTLSKAWGLAGLRLGVAYSNPEIIDLFMRIKPPFNINSVSQSLALEALENITEVNKWIKIIAEERREVAEKLSTYSFVEKVYDSRANFLFVKVSDAPGLYQHLYKKNIMIRSWQQLPRCTNCVRITIGTPAENQKLLDALKEFEP